ncbi:MAG: hypothetical protein LBV27_11130, partial [Oscillospiraceae bacterium]|nr:hypothetical protein [Oscillospiraceae bacterium]
MKEIRVLSTGWYIKDYAFPAEPGEEAFASILSETLDETWLRTDMPNTAQEVLWVYDRLDKTVLETGADPDKKCAWVAERDWAFRTAFSRPAEPGRVFLEFDGIDAVAHIVLNGKILHYHQSMYLKSRVDITEYILDENDLLIYVHSPYKMIDFYGESLPERYAGKINARALLRKAPEDFSPYAGFVPYFTPIGLYDDVRLVVSECEIEYVDVDVRFNQNNTRADISVRLECPVVSDVIAEVQLESPDGTLAPPVQSTAWRKSGDKMEAVFKLSVHNPELWWPRNYGRQPLYTLKASISKNGLPLDTQSKTLGIRHIELVGDMKFRVNGKIVKLWGADITPMWGPSHRWIPERGKNLLDYAEQANMNTLRMWGPSQPYHDEFYEEADRRGFLLWQDFFTGGAYMPDTTEHIELITHEAVQQIRRLKHHASILLWCGGNEQLYTSDLAHRDETDRIGHDILYYGFKDICAAMDPCRYYHTSCPSGGEYANQASFGDNHGSRASRSFLPGEAYATLFTEDIRTTVPEINSLRRFIPADGLWPEGYRDITNYCKLDQLPPAWVARTRAPRSYEKSGPHEQFFDATDPESLVYKVNEAAAHDMRLIMNASRRGKPYHMSWDERKTQGH